MTPFGTAEEFLNSAAQACGCVVASGDLPGTTGWELVERVQSQGWPLPTIVLTHLPDTRRTVDAMRHGAVAVVEKPVRREELVAAMELAMLQEEQASKRNARIREFKERVATMNNDERRVMEMVIQGEPNKVIASLLHVSLRTVELRRRNVFLKTHTGSIAELVRRAVEAGLAPS